MRRRVFYPCWLFVGWSGILATGVAPSAVAVVYLAAVTPWLVWFDVTSHRLPNVLVVPGVGVGVVSCVGEWVVSGRLPVVPLVAGVGYAGFLLVMQSRGRHGMAT